MNNTYGRLASHVYNLDKYIGKTFGDIDYYRERLLGCRGPILEPAVGNGRALIPLLEAGFDVSGFDASQDMLDYCRDDLTDYELASLLAAKKLTVELVDKARSRHTEYRARVDGLFDRHDMLLIPAMASPPFAIGERPREIDGRRVGRLWGAFPFTSPFNVAGNPAAAIPCGVVRGLPVSAQLVARSGQDAALLDLAQDLEEALSFRDEIAALQDGRAGHG